MIQISYSLDSIKKIISNYSNVDNEVSTNHFFIINYLNLNIGKGEKKTRIDHKKHA